MAWLGTGFAALTAATVALMVLGATVRAHGAGLACPDWPLCFGRLVPSFDARVALEWAHRALAGGIAASLAVLTALFARRGERRARGALAVAWLLLAAQVVLGGLTVWLRLAPWTVTAHLLVGTAFAATLFWIARSLAEVPGPARAPRPPGAAAAVIAVVALFAVQVTLGGLVSSHAAGLACASFPTCDGTSFAPALGGAVGLHVLHRGVAYALLLGFGALLAVGRRSPALARLAWAGLNLVILQIGLGALNVLMRLPPEVTALHTLTAAALALALVLIARETLLAPAPSSARAAPRARPLEAAL